MDPVTAMPSGGELCDSHLLRHVAVMDPILLNNSIAVSTRARAILRTTAR